MDIHIVIGSCGLLGNVKTWIVDAWEEESGADKRMQELEDLKIGFWGKVFCFSQYEFLKQGRIVEDKMRTVENGDPGYLNDVFIATSYHTKRIELKSWQDKEPENDSDWVEKLIPFGSGSI